MSDIPGSDNPRDPADPVDETMQDESMQDETSLAAGDMTSAANDADPDSGAQVPADADDESATPAADEAGAEAESMAQVGDESPAEFNHPALKQILEGAILAADRPLGIEQMISLFVDEQPSRKQVRAALAELDEDFAERGFELKEVASGYRFQVRSDYAPWVSRLWEEKPPRYTRALLETLALIAYKQPITRGDIEEIRGVAVSTNIIRSLLEREWIRVVGHRDVPGRPAMYATTREFLDYFNLSSLEELPTLSEIRDLDKVNESLDLEEDVIEIRSLEIEEEEAPDVVDDTDLDEVTARVNSIQDNIRQLFNPDPEPDDELEADTDTDTETDRHDAAEAEASDSSQNNEVDSEAPADDEAGSESATLDDTDDVAESGREAVPDPRQQLSGAVDPSILDAAFAEDDSTESDPDNSDKPDH